MEGEYELMEVKGRTIVHALRKKMKVDVKLRPTIRNLGISGTTEYVKKLSIHWNGSISEKINSGKIRRIATFEKGEANWWSHIPQN